ncbi:MAG: MFS transporter, partial [Planctomycetaceae bacterium]
RFRFSVIVQLLGLLGMVLVFVSSTAVALATGVVLLSLLLGYNYFASLFYNREANDDRQKGRAFGLNEAFLGFGAAGGALLGGWVASDWGERAPFQISAVLIAVSLVVQLAWFSSQLRPPKEASTTGDQR